MTENEARDWAIARFDADAIERLDQLSAIVTIESDQQNLVARSTLSSIWSRHIVDSLQLIPHAPVEGDWLDIGTGAGFPGLAIACAQPDRHMLLVEPRRLRADFLRQTASALDLDRVDVITAKVESVETTVSVISARAVAPVDALLGSAIRCSRKDTVWLLPKGRSAHEELARARQRWHGVFHVEQSLTDPESSILIASGVRRR